MQRAEFCHYDIRCDKRNCQVLVPKDISQLWVLHYLDQGSNYEEVFIYGNRKALEAVRNACAVLAGDRNMVVYFPSKKNHFPSWADPEDRINVVPMDLVLMKPNALKICDWKKIRDRIKEQGKEWSFHFERSSKDMYVKDKYRFREPAGKEVFRFDTVFYNIPRYGYPSLVSNVEKLLDADREAVFREEMATKGVCFDWNYLYLGKRNTWSRIDIEPVINFFDEDIFKEVRGQHG